MLNILLDLFTGGKSASIYTDCNSTNRFDFGKVIAVNENDIAIHMISPDGEDDGITVMHVDNIFRVETDGQYAEKMKKLCDPNNIPQHNLEIKNNDIFKSALSFAAQEKQIISIELLDSGSFDAVGFPEITENNECILHQVDEYGYDDGISYFSIENITKISMLSQEEKRIMRLWDLNLLNGLRIDK